MNTTWVLTVFHILRYLSGFRPGVHVCNDLGVRLECRVFVAVVRTYSSIPMSIAIVSTAIFNNRISFVCFCFSHGNNIDLLSNDHNLKFITTVSELV